MARQNASLSANGINVRLNNMAKVLIYSPNVIGPSMAGAAIRAWEFAKALSHQHDVVLISPSQPESKGENFEVISAQDSHYKKHFQTAQVLITQRLTFSLAWLAKRNGVKVIIDAYDPSPLELMEQFKTEAVNARQEKVFSAISTLLFSFKMADGILCASEKQRDLWMGFMLAQKRIDPMLYDQDSSLKQFIEVVPFGLSESPPQKKGKGLREKYGLKSTDKMILWGGGIWNWFDPLSAIRAMKIISQTRTDVKLVFMGVKPPDPDLVEMEMSAQAFALAKELDVIDRFVFFNQEWIPYEERQAILLEADVGISTHFDHLETRFSFRTRLLDYIWAQLPIVATKGDVFAELIERHQLGIVVPDQKEEAIAEAILTLVDHPTQLQAIKANLARLCPQFYWKTVVKPVDCMITRLSHQQTAKCPLADFMAILQFMCTKVREKGLRFCINKFYQQFITRKVTS